MSRFCSLVEYNVVGGASKLLESFRKLNSGKTLMTFSDLRWGSGKVYESLGFSFVAETRPNYYYFGKLTEWKRKHRYFFTKQKLIEHAKRLEIEVVEGDTETSLAEKLNLYRIYDCGHKKFQMTL